MTPSCSAIDVNTDRMHLAVGGPAELQPVHPHLVLLAATLVVVGWGLSVCRGTRNLS
jgi:hypothetical protein